MEAARKETFERPKRMTQAAIEMAMSERRKNGEPDDREINMKEKPSGVFPPYEQVKLMVNMRFGSKTWDRIVAERSRRVKAAEKRLKAQKLRRQDQIETAAAVGFLLACVAAICGFMAWYYLRK